MFKTCLCRLGPALIITAVLTLLLALSLSCSPARLAASSPDRPSTDSSLQYRTYLPILQSPAGWYRLRVCVTSTSDFCSVVLTGTARILASGLVDARGGHPRDGGERTALLLQGWGDAQRGTQVTATKDWALARLGQSLYIELQRGDLGSVQVEVWDAGGVQPTRVATATWSGLNPPSNAYTLTLNRSALLHAVPSPRTPDEVTADARRCFDTLRQSNLQLPEADSRLHRATITFTSSSDWCETACSAGLDIVAVRQTRTLGNPTLAEARHGGFRLHQPLPQAQAGVTIGLAADVAFTPLPGTQAAEWVISKGHLGAATVEIYNANGARPVLVRSQTHRGVASTTDPLNSLTFTLGLPALTANGPLAASTPGLPRMVWAFYYLWYNLDAWDSSILKDTPSIRYSSDDPQTLARHIEQAQGAGIDGFAASWWGPGDYSDANLRRLLDAAAAREFQIVANLETLGEGSQPRSEADLQRWLEYLLSQYGQHPAYYRWQGKPVVVVWSSSTVPLETWGRIFAYLRGKGLDARFVAHDWNPLVLNEFWGVHEYGVGGQCRLGELYQDAARGIRGYSLLNPESEPRLWSATLQPGYDERTIPGRSGWFWERWDGDTYRYTFESALKSAPDWLFITTWNEWWEHTYIEPSVHYGDLFLRLTREFAAQWKAQSGSR